MDQLRQKYTNWLINQNLNYALKFNGTNQYASLGTMGNFGSNLGSGFYCKVPIQTPSTSQGFIWGVQNPYIQLQANSAANGANVNHALQFTTYDTSNNLLRGGCNSPTINFNDGQKHTIEIDITYSTNTIVIKIDGTVQTITYDTQGTPHTFSNFAGSLFLGCRNQNGTPDSFFACTLDNFQIGTSASNIFASYAFDQSHGNPLGDLMSNNPPLIAHGTPIPKQQPGRFFFPSAMRGL